MQGERISLGIFCVFSGLSLILLMRGSPNDTYSGILVFLIALIQLFEYGIWNDLDCNPGGSNNKASRGTYILLWAFPALLSLAAAFFSTNIIADPASRTLLMGVGFVFTALACSLLPILWADKRTWCSQPGANWIPIWSFFDKDGSPLALNPIWLIGILIPTLLVDPLFLGSGTAAILTGAYLIGCSSDKLMKGEWASVTAVLSNGVGIWALMVPTLRGLIFGFPPVLHVQPL
jgi:hypothetical protein